jgi:hypothetical protein
MIRYAILLFVPVVGGVLIAVAIVGLNGLRERQERKCRELDEARRLDRAPLCPGLSAGPAADLEDRRIAS